MSVVWRAVIDATVSQYYGTNRGSVRLTLAGCGHTRWQKKSQLVPRRARCSDCEGLAAGTVAKYDIGGGEMRVETWDAELKLPRKEVKQRDFGKGIDR